MARKRTNRQPARAGKAEERQNGASGAPCPPSHLDWMNALVRSPRGTVTEREKVLGATVAIWAVSPVIGECDWPLAKLAGAIGMVEAATEIAIERLIAAGWMDSRTREDARGLSGLRSGFSPRASTMLPLSGGMIFR